MIENLIGKTKQEVIALLTKNKSNFRIRREDGVSSMGIANYDTSRFNLYIEEGIVVEVTLG